MSINTYLAAEIELDEAERHAVLGATHFVGVDLAPTEMLESGLVVLDRQGQLLRTDKMYKSQTLFESLLTIAEPHRLVVALDMPKNFGIESKFQQEEVKNHALRLEPWTGQPSVDRYSQRARVLYDALRREGAFPFLGFTSRSKVALGLDIPFKARTPQGCKALQAKIKEKLQLGNMPSNLAPSSVLDAMIGAYTAWQFFQLATQPNRLKTAVSCFVDDESRLSVLMN